MKVTVRSFGPLCLLVTGLAPGCGGSDARPKGNLFDPNAGDPSLPGIAERPQAGSYVCSVTRDRTSHVSQGRLLRSVLQPVPDGSTYLARLEGSDPVFSTAQRFVVSSLALDGSFGAPSTIPASDAKNVRGFATAPQGRGFAMVWVEKQVLQFATFDDKGQLVGLPKLVTTIGLDPYASVLLRMVADRAGHGFAVALSMTTDQLGKPHAQPRALFLDANGVLQGSVRTLGAPPANPEYPFVPDLHVTAAPDGFAFVWNDLDNKGSRMFFTKTDGLGNEIVAPHVITSIQGEKLSYSGGGARIVEASGGFVAAWTEAHTGVFDGESTYRVGDNNGPGHDGWAVVRLIRLDAQGAPTVLSATMRATTDDVDEVEPVLTPFEDAVAVSWGHGSHIYVCAGCIPDHRIDFMLIDPSTLTPVSNVVTVTNGGGTRAGGLLGKQVAVSGSSFLVYYDLRFHVATEPGSAVFTCKKNDPEDASVRDSESDL